MEIDLGTLIVGCGSILVALVGFLFSRQLSAFDRHVEALWKRTDYLTTGLHSIDTRVSLMEATRNQTQD